MQIYLVGGAVRDQLLGYPIGERDWVVVGATPQQLIDLGYKPVGKDFPVFLHPKTHEEYALARTERKIALGYKGFQVYAAPDVTLEQDLQRRDLTINAMAQATDGTIIDPYHGRVDLNDRILRHVSSAFIEDPVRILRVARFAARFGEFTIHPNTQLLMQEMVRRGEVNALVAERVWQEWQRALSEPYPQRFFTVLSECGALAVLLPEWQDNAMELAALTRAVTQNSPASVRFAVSLHTMPAATIRNIAERYRIPREYADLAVLVSKYYSEYQNLASLTAAQLLQLLEHLDAFRRSERIELFLSAAAAIADDSSQADYLRRAYAAAKNVSLSPEVIASTTDGQAIKQLMLQQRLAAIQAVRAEEACRKNDSK